MKEILEGIWNAPAEEVYEALTTGLIYGGVGFVVLLVVTVLIMWWIAR